MEQSKHLEPNFSESFGQLSEVLFNNYRDNHSIGSGSIYGGKSQKSGYTINNNLVERVKRETSQSSIEEGGLTI